MSHNLSGFPEFLPQETIFLHWCMKTVQKCFETHGFCPMETPAVERKQTLLAKGDDHEIYGLHRLTDPSSAEKSDLALRFDLTVPLARYVEQYYGALTFPYRRYHIAPVWRGERAQAGRYRQFYQCDVDVIGDKTLSDAYDAEVIYVLWKGMQSLGVSSIEIHLNHRQILHGLCESFSMPQDKIPEVIRWIDKKSKYPSDVWEQNMTQVGASQELIQTLKDLSNISSVSWHHLADLADTPIFKEGVDALRRTHERCLSFGIPSSHLVIDPLLARGLGYYTGTVWETIWLDHPALGSISGGGRYDHLTQSMGKKVLPGVGGSIGLSRILDKLLASRTPSAQTPSQVLITTDPEYPLTDFTKLGQACQNHPIATEVYLDASVPLKNQLKYGHKKGIPFVVIFRSEERSQHKALVKDMKTGLETLVPLGDLPVFIQDQIAMQDSMQEKTSTPA